MRSLNVLYEEDSTKIKREKSRKIYLKKMIIWVAETIFLISSCIAFGNVIGIIIFTIMIFTILPTPFLKVPAKYQITKEGIVYDGKMFSVYKIYRVKVNMKERYVAICHPLRGELIRLYTQDPNKLYKILCETKNGREKRSI
ncbi:MAG: DUF2208 family protein [Candidatus Methanomethylicia archaeon]